MVLCLVDIFCYPYDLLNQVEVACVQVNNYIKPFKATKDLGMVKCKTDLGDCKYRLRKAPA